MEICPLGKVGDGLVMGIDIGAVGALGGSWFFGVGERWI